MIGIKKGLFKSVREITESELKSVMTVRIEYPCLAIRVIVCHAPQETDNKEVRKEFYEELAIQIERGITSGDATIVVGDLNARITTLEGKVVAVPSDEIMAEIDKVNTENKGENGDEEDSYVAENESPNGKLLSDLINDYKLKVGNFHPKAAGKWTRIQDDKEGVTHKSVLDYVLLQNEMYDAVTGFEVDEDKVCCPYHEKTEKGIKRIVHSDHCTIIVNLLIETGRVFKPSSKKLCWHFNDTGYDKYEEESEKAIYVKEHAENCSASDVYDAWTVEFEKLLSRCFRKRTIKEGAVDLQEKKNQKTVREILMKISRKGKVQREVVKTYLTRMLVIESLQIAESRAERLRNTMSQLSANEKFSPTGYWKMKKAAKKGTRKTDEASSIIKDNV